MSKEYKTIKLIKYILPFFCVYNEFKRSGEIGIQLIKSNDI